MGLAERLAKASDRMFDRMRSPKAMDIASASATGKLDDLKGRKYCLLVSYRKNGDPMPSPLWFGTGNGKLYFHTAAYSAKVKRIRKNPEVRVAPANNRGVPRGAPFVGQARILGGDETAEAERAIQANYGAGRRIYTKVGGDRVDSVYVEVTPVA
jgi:PPOX class probable F420-dependent enzyme